MPLLCSCSPRLTRTCELYHRTGPSIVLRRCPVVPVSNGPKQPHSQRRNSAPHLRLPIIRRVSGRVRCPEIAALSEASRNPSAVRNNLDSRGIIFYVVSVARSLEHTWRFRATCSTYKTAKELVEFSEPEVGPR